MATFKFQKKESVHTQMIRKTQDIPYAERGNKIEMLFVHENQQQVRIVRDLYLKVFVLQIRKAAFANWITVEVKKISYTNKLNKELLKKFYKITQALGTIKIK
jgi:hypothetical protein